MDLRKNGVLSCENAKRIDLLEKRLVAEYNDFIGEFIQVNKLTGIDLLLTPSCRNTIVCKIYDVFCRLALLEENLSLGLVPETVDVDNKLIANLVYQLLNKHNISNTKVVYQQRSKNIVSVIVTNILKSLYLIINSWLWSRLFLTKTPPTGKIVFVDTFLLKNSIDVNGHYHDRYYTGHETHLSQKENNTVWFAPTLFGIRHPKEYITIFKQIKSSNRHFLIKERWLTISDYLSSALQSIVIPFKVKKYPSYRDLDFKAFLKKEVLSDIASPALIRALCQFRFIRRLSIEKINIADALNWCENQINDRALNLSFKTYYPDVCVKGYQGFMLIDYYASLLPTEYELEAGTLPNVLHVINKACFDRHKKSCKNLPLKMSPAFRFSHLFALKDRRSAADKVILIPLPGVGMENESIGIIHTYLSIAKNLDNNIRVLIKPHPSYSRDQFMALSTEFSNPLLAYTEKEIPELLEVSSALISTASSVCVEAVAVGIPVAIYGSRSGITMNPIPDTVPKERWEIFYTPQQLLDFLRASLEHSHRKPIVQDLFHAVDKQGTRELFTIRCP